MPKERNKADGYREKAYEGDTKAISLLNHLNIETERTEAVVAADHRTHGILILIHQVRIDSLTLKYPRLISVIMIFLFFSFLLSDISSGTWLFRGNSCPMFYNDFGAWSNNVRW